MIDAASFNTCWRTIFVLFVQAIILQEIYN